MRAAGVQQCIQARSCCAGNAFKCGPLESANRRKIASRQQSVRSGKEQVLLSTQWSPQASRRDVCGGSLLAAAALVLETPRPAVAGLERYVKKKQLDPLDTYVPLVLEARGVLADLEGVMVVDPSQARQLLRSGPFRGMRDNIRALGQYASQPQTEGGSGLPEATASALVAGFFKALEDFDLLLYNAVREYKQQAQQQERAAAKEEGGSDAEGATAAAVDPAVGLDKQAAAEKLRVVQEQLDKLIATVPPGVLAKSQLVLEKVTGKPVSVPGLEP